MSDDSAPAVAEPAAARGGPISHAIFRVARLHRMLAGQLLRETGLYPGQELLMMQLWDRGPQRQTDLVRVLGSDAATMTRSIQRLERAGFVRRKEYPADRRVTIIEATPASQGLRRDIERLWKRLEKITVAGLDEGRQAEVLADLTALEANLLESAGS